MRNQRKRVTNTSGETGVDASGRTWRARWTDLHGVGKSRAFKTKEEAINYRALMLKEMNSRGAGYTERHGT